MDPLQALRCSHGKLPLGCPHDDCEVQRDFIERHRVAIDHYFTAREEDARAIVREALGWPS